MNENNKKACGILNTPQSRFMFGCGYYEKYFLNE